MLPSIDAAGQLVGPVNEMIKNRALDAKKTKIAVPGGAEGHF